MVEAATKHSLMGGKLHVYRRENSGMYQCSTYLSGKNHRTSTKTDSLSHAKAFAEDWYLELHGKLKRGELKMEKTFKEAAAQFEREYEVLTEGQRADRYVKSQSERIALHLNPFFGSMGLSQITPGTMQDYRVHRMTSRKDKDGKPKRPSRSTLHQETVALRQILKFAVRHGWLSHVPDLSPPYKTSGKVSHRAWFSPEDYKRLYEHTRKRAAEAKGKRWEYECEQFHDFVLVMANTGLRPDEAMRLEYRDVAVVDDTATGETILEIEVRGKRGVGFCKSTAGAVVPFKRLLKRNQPEPTDRVFPVIQRELLNNVLDELKLKTDRDGQRRTAYSLRHTYISMRLMEGADIYQIAKNCRTSVEMIENFYASHIKTSLNAAAINVRR
jgi:integrase